MNLKKYKRSNMVLLNLTKPTERAKYLYTGYTDKSKLRIMMWLKRIMKRIKKTYGYPRLFLSISTCRYYKACNSVIAALEGNKIYVEKIPVFMK
jgi:hypothetical protein